MKKHFLPVLILFIFCAFCLCADAQTQTKTKKKQKTKQKIEFVSKDKFILIGDFYLPDEKSNKPLVVLLHSFSQNARCWSDLAQILRGRGYNVLAMDLRGHGRSVYTEKLKFKSRYNFTASDWQRLPSDVVDSINYLKHNYSKINTDDIIMVGADIGANTAMVSGILLKKVPQKFVLISPMYEFKGIKMPVKTTRTADSKILMVLSKSDKILFDFNTKEKPIIKRYPIGGPGVQLLKVNKGAADDVINFIVNN